MAYERGNHPDRIYVKVTSDFDCTGFMQPRDIIWRDGRVFHIDEIRDFRPASSVDRALPGDCYTVLINGETRHLYFERTSDRFASRFGRWFVESAQPAS
ncbi:MAG: hypothetical protein IJ231_07170 [Clostridia bacterium]|nr:hypothetical protein [Clostridia bacterium]